MRLEKILLYLFSIENPYFESYAWAVELALRMNAKLQPFTSSPNNQLTTYTQSVYHSLLAAHGYYLQHYRPKGKSNEIIHVPCIIQGDQNVELISHLKKNPVDIVIVESQLTTVGPNELKNIAKASGGVILMAPTGRDSGNQAGDQRFYDNLKRARLYKVPKNFFAILGKDRSAFNYLRDYFQKNLA